MTASDGDRDERLDDDEDLEEEESSDDAPADEDSADDDEDDDDDDEDDEDDEDEPPKPAAKKERKPAAKPKLEELDPFAEGESHETRMTFDHGGFPLYVKLVWVAFLVGMAMYLYTYYLPDLTAWSAH